MKNIIKQIVIQELTSRQIKEKMTGFLVKSKKRGTYQALSECSKEEESLVEYLTDYLDNWVMSDLTSGEMRKLLNRELIMQIEIELSRKGFHKIFES